MARNVFITWHYTTHGVAYLKHILSCFYEKNTTDAAVFKDDKFEQDHCNAVFNTNNGHKRFDKIYYLTVKEEVIKKVSSRLHYHNLSYQNDEGLQAMNLVHIYDAIREHDDIKYNVDKELQFVKDNTRKSIENNLIKFFFILFPQKAGQWPVAITM